MTNKKHLLIVSCSMTKKNWEEPRPARDVYVGPTFQALKNRLTSDSPFDVYVVSAKYGLINWNDEIEWYEQRMTFGRAVQLLRQVSDGIKSLLASGKYVDCFVNLGADYMVCAKDGLINSPIPIECASGGMGDRLGQTVKWVEDRL